MRFKWFLSVIYRLWLLRETKCHSKYLLKALRASNKHNLHPIPSGFLPVESSISEVEVWGLGGKTAKEVQNSYKKREELFTEQRRKVDLKTFSNWEDSPEKMMMEMMAARRSLSN